jgi:hypothetical protein
MMPLRAVLIIVLFVIGIVNAVHAEQAGFEYREKRGLIVLEDFQQSADLRYQFTDHHSNADTGNSTSNSLQELYNVSLNTAILDPNIFESSLNGIIGFNQSSFNSGGGNSSSDQAQYQYLFSGTSLKRSLTPISFNSSRQISTVTSQYTPAYTTDTTNNQVTALILNDILSSRFDFARNTLDSSGGGYNSSTTSNSFSYKAEHNYGKISNTILNGSLSDQDSSIGNSHVNTVSLTNSLAWGAGKKYSLLTSIRLQDAVYTGVPEFNLTYSESFRVQLGLALSLEANYSLVKTRTNDYLGQNSEDNENSGDIALRHRLFDSLETALIGKASSGELLGGTETKYSGTARMNYRKLLPEQSRMTAVISNEYEVVDRNVTSSVTTVQNQSFTGTSGNGVLPGDTITLPPSGAILQTIIQISNFTTNGAPLINYTEGTDYTVNYALGTIYILPGGRINNPNGTILIISFTYFINPNLKYNSNTFSGSTNITLFNGAYSLGGSYTQQRYSNIVGAPDNSLRNLRTIQLQFGGTRERSNFRLLLTDSVLGDLRSDTVEGNGQYFWEDLSLSLLERYALYGPSETSVGYRENTTQCSLVYARPIFSNAQFSTTTSLMDIRSSIRKTNDYATFRGSLKILLNKLTITMVGQTGWIFSSGTTTRDDSLNVNVTRYF